MDDCFIAYSRVLDICDVEDAYPGLAIDPSRPSICLLIHPVSDGVKECKAHRCNKLVEVSKHLTWLSTGNPEPKPLDLGSIDEV